MSDDATPGNVPLSDLLGPTAWALTAFGRVQKLVMRADVADELACKWRESDPEATAVPLYSWAAVEAERERCAKLCDELHAEMLDQGVASAYGDAFARRIRGA